MATAFRASIGVLNEEDKLVIHQRLKRRSFTYHEKAVTCPQAVPAFRTVGNIGILTVHGNDLCRGLADGAPTDIESNALPLDWSHRRRHRLFSAQPVAVVVARGKLTNIVQIAVPVNWEMRGG